MRRSIQGMSVLLGCIWLSACSSVPTPEQAVVENLPTNPEVEKAPYVVSESQPSPFPNDPNYAPVRTVINQTVQVPNGSLFNENNFIGILIHNRKYRIGDMVQVVLEEETSASKNQALNNNNSAEMNISPLQVTAGPIRVDGDLAIDHTQEAAFQSNSNSSQQNSLVGVINVFVSEVLSNGNLVVSGEKWITLNEGREFIRVTGELRTQDILPNNTISSTKLGNSRIEYSGAGRQKDNQAPSIVTKILSILG